MGDFGEYVVLYLAALTLSVFLVPAVRRLAIRMGAIDLPDRVRKIHTRMVPRMGGVAIFIAFIVPIIAAYVVGRLWFRNSLLYIELERQIVPAIGLLSAALLMLALGVYDDLREASPKLKLLVQAAAGAILCVVGITISSFQDPFTGRMVELGWVAYPLTIFWVMAVTNAINLIDGMDGLGPGVGLFVAGTMFVISLFYGVPLMSTVASVLVGAIVGFLIFNFHPAKIFMGDSGSLFIGFLLSALAVQCSVKRVLLVPVIALALPIVDTCMAIVRRWSKGLPMSVPDKQHVHHRLIAMGFSQREAVFILYVISAVLGCAALVVVLLNKENRLAVAVAYSFIIAAIVAMAYVLGGRDLWRLLKRVRAGWHHRRARDRGWTQVYAAAARMESAASVDQLWEDAAPAFDALGIDVALVSLDAPGGAPRHLEWRRPGDRPEMNSTGGLCEGWTLRLPLSGDKGVHGELMLGKDTRRSALLDAVTEMAELLRTAMGRAVERLAADAAAAGPSVKTPATSRTAS